MQGQGQGSGGPGKGSGGSGKGSGGPGKGSGGPGKGSEGPGKGSGGPGKGSERAGSIPDKFDAVVKNGKTTLKCSFTMVFNGAKVDTKKSKAKCTGAKKTEKVNNAR